MSTAPHVADGLARVLDLASAALDDPAATGDDLAARAHLSRFHFDRLVAATSGEPPGAMRRRLLLERAAYQLLRHRDRTVLAVAVEAGYGSHEAFTRSFARAYGRTPTSLRREPPRSLRDLDLEAASGVHFHPPGGLRLPATTQEEPMELVTELVDHHVDALTALLEAAGQVPGDVLDRPITTSVETVDDDPTLRRLLNAMVTQEEHWLSALRGGGWPDESDQTLEGLRSRHAAAGPDYRTFVTEAVTEGRLRDTFLDTTCDPPEVYSVGAMIGHVITFAAVRRTQALGALWTAGHRDLALADPRPRIDRDG